MNTVKDCLSNEPGCATIIVPSMGALGKIPFLPEWKYYGRKNEQGIKF